MEENDIYEENGPDLVAQLQASQRLKTNRHQQFSVDTQFLISKSIENPNSSLNETRKMKSSFLEIMNTPMVQTDRIKPKLYKLQPKISATAHGSPRNDFFSRNHGQNGDSSNNRRNTLK